MKERGAKILSIMKSNKKSHDETKVRNIQSKSEAGKQRKNHYAKGKEKELKITEYALRKAVVAAQLEADNAQKLAAAQKEATEQLLDIEKEADDEVAHAAERYLQQRSKKIINIWPSYSDINLSGKSLSRRTMMQHLKLLVRLTIRRKKGSTITANHRPL